MLFNSIEYALFLPLVVVVHWRLRGRRARLGLLLGASYVFYGAWDVRFLGLLFLTTTIDYLVGLGLGRRPHHAPLLAVSIVSNVAVLGLFKYFDFFVTSAQDLLVRAGLEASYPTLRVLLPVGISFYTFQAMAYTIDVYRGVTSPVRDPLVFYLYLSFFPQLVAGPIERANHLVPQLAADRPPPDRDTRLEAFYLLASGLVKKVVFADTLAPFVDEVFFAGALASPAAIATATVAFGLQIYGDFSGYTDIARGSALLVNVRLMENFRHPYGAADPQAFWRRWHRSLSLWFRDYVYIPLGGNRRSRARTALNILLTMAIAGLWHGAAWTFVAWGVLHGLLLVAQRTVRVRVPARLGTVATFVAVMLLWIPFRAATLTQAAGMTVRMFTPSLHDVPLVWIALVVVAWSVFRLLDRGKEAAVWKRVGERPLAAAGALGLMALAVLVVSDAGSRPFIYFRF